MIYWNGQLQMDLPTISSSTSISVSHSCNLLLNSASGPLTVFFPDQSPAPGTTIWVKDFGSSGAGGSSTNAITIAGNGNLVAGASNVVIVLDGMSLTFTCDGTNWGIM